MDEKVRKQLEQEEHTPFNKQMLNDSKALVDLSRTKMRSYYDQWDKNDDTFRSIMARDKDDIAASERKEPEKMVIPQLYAQIQTFVAFCYSLYTQRDSFFELEGFTAEDDRPAKIGESLLNRDLSHNLWEAKLYQFLLDIARFGFGVMKCCWVTEKQLMRQKVEIPPMTFMGVQLRAGRTEETIDWATAYQGNKILNISPYKFFPDTRLPLTRFQEGEFCASEELYTRAKLRQWEHEGEIAGVKWIKDSGRDVANERSERWNTDADSVGDNLKGDGQTKNTIIITEVQREIIPSEYEVDGEPLGEEDYPVKYVIWIANDHRVVKCEPMNYIHNQFTYSVAPFVYDNNALISDGLADLVDQLQAVVSWFINARITNVRKVIGDKLVVNPTMINMDDLKQRRPVIRLSAAAAGEIDRYIKQLPLQDVTSTHINDAKVLSDMMKEVSGINDTLLGTIRPGKRSATENRNTTSGASARQRTLACIIFRAAIEQMGRQMLSNLRDGLDEATYVKLLGAKAFTTPEFVQVTREDLIGNYDFEIFDGTLPTERFYTAQALEELLGTLLTNPQAAAIFQIDPRKVFYEALTLRGVKNPERFQLDPTQYPNAGLLMDQQQPPGTGTGPTAIPGVGPAATAAPVTGGPGGVPAGIPGAVPEQLLPLLAGTSGTGGAAGAIPGV